MFAELITKLLHDGYNVRFSAPGRSMYPTIKANETIVVAPIDPWTVRLGDVILYQTKGRLVAHRVMRIEKKPDNLSRASRSSAPARLQFPIKCENPRFKRTAHKAQRFSNDVLHFVLRGDAASIFDDPVQAGQIIGKVIAVEKNGRRIDPYSFRHQLVRWTYKWASRLKSIFF